MNWYKAAIEQTSFPFAEDDSNLGQSPQIYHSQKSEETLKKLMGESKGYLAIESNLIRFSYDWELVKLPSGDREIRVRIGGETYVIDDFLNPRLKRSDDI